MHILICGNLLLYDGGPVTAAELEQCIGQIFIEILWTQGLELYLL